MKKVVFMGILEGFIGSTILDFVVTFIFLLNQTSFIPIPISLLSAIACSIVYAVFAKNYKRNLAVICFSLTGFLSFILSYIGILALHISMPFSVFALREGNNADGIITLICIVSFVITSSILKLLIFSIIAIRNGKQNKAGGQEKGQGDGSLS